MSDLLAAPNYVQDIPIAPLIPTVETAKPSEPTPEPARLPTLSAILNGNWDGFGSRIENRKFFNLIIYVQVLIGLRDQS